MHYSRLWYHVPNHIPIGYAPSILRDTEQEDRSWFDREDVHSSHEESGHHHQRGEFLDTTDIDREGHRGLEITDYIDGGGRPVHRVHRSWVFWTTRTSICFETV